MTHQLALMAPFSFKILLQIMRAEDFEKMMMAQAQPTEPNPVSQGAPGAQGTE